MYYANNYSKVHSSQDMTDNSIQLLLGLTLIMIEYCRGYSGTFS